MFLVRNVEITKIVSVEVLCTCCSPFWLLAFAFTMTTTFINVQETSSIALALRDKEINIISLSELDDLEQFRKVSKFTSMFKINTT